MKVSCLFNAYISLCVDNENGMDFNENSRPDQESNLGTLRLEASTLTTAQNYKTKNP